MLLVALRHDLARMVANIVPKNNEVRPISLQVWENGLKLFGVDGLVVDVDRL